MVLVERYGTSSRMVLVFEGDDEGKTVEQIMAEAICRLAPNGGPVSCWAVHFCSARHPFSTTQRLRELSKKYYSEVRQGNPNSGAVSYYFDKSKMVYDFAPMFVNWLRTEYLDKEPVNVQAN